MTDPEYKPDYDEHGVGYCSHELCPQYDGKRCRMTGFQPHSVCKPWGIEAARDQKAMLALQTASQTHRGWFVRITNQRKVWWNPATGKWAFLLTPKKSYESDIISEHETMAEAVIAASSWNLNNPTDENRQERIHASRESIGS